MHPPPRLSHSRIPCSLSMPAQRHTRKYNRSPPPTQRRQTPPVFGPLSQEEPAISGLYKTAALDKISQLIREAARPLAAPKPAGPVPPHVQGHIVLGPFLGNGKNGHKSTVGRWYQVCRTCNHNCYFLTPSLDSSAFAANTELGRLWCIFEEIKAYHPRAREETPLPTPQATSRAATRVRHHRTGPAPDPAAPPVTLPLPDAALPHALLPLCVSNLLSPDKIESGEDFDLSLPVLLSVNIGVFTFFTIPHSQHSSIFIQNQLIEETVFPRHDSYIRLNDFKMLLGTRGFEQGRAIEVYDFTANEWVATTWRTPQFASGNRNILAIRFVV
ncbi:hypothetical protein NLJ89_g5116 [Agrocybe chaxingu]|uniref:Uncharacterized protein n=1 Tax=Agrocybe chaxingu TaxID=84603 RepID=A0A9W8K1L8_9AGAR|nr:hypothetical protein NLJ89_g5116 [Agrocybe chaxingu]